MTASKTIFLNSEQSLEVMDEETVNLNTALKSNDGSKVNNQLIDDQTKVVHGMLKSQAMYVNKVAQ